MEPRGAARSRTEPGGGLARPRGMPRGMPRGRPRGARFRGPPCWLPGLPASWRLCRPRGNAWWLGLGRHSPSSGPLPQRSESRRSGAGQDPRSSPRRATLAQDLRGTSAKGLGRLRAQWVRASRAGATGDGRCVIQTPTIVVLLPPRACASTWGTFCCPHRAVTGPSELDTNSTPDCPKAARVWLRGPGPRRIDPSVAEASRRHAAGSRWARGVLWSQQCCAAPPRAHGASRSLLERSVVEPRFSAGDRPHPDTDLTSISPLTRREFGERPWIGPIPTPDQPNSTRAAPCSTTK